MKFETFTFILALVIPNIVGFQVDAKTQIPVEIRVMTRSVAESVNVVKEKSCSEKVNVLGQILILGKSLKYLYSVNPQIFGQKISLLASELIIVGFDARNGNPCDERSSKQYKVSTARFNEIVGLFNDLEVAFRSL